MSDWGRYLKVSTLLVTAAVPVSTMFARRYGSAAACRFGAGMAGTLGGQQALVGLALKRRVRASETDQVHLLNVAELITLSRGAAAAVLVGLSVSRIRERRGFAGWLGWSVLLYGSILCDWLDGPIARHLGTSEMGVLFDLESDSWLTLCAAGSAIAWGDLPVAVAGAPVLRYILMFSALGNTRYAELHVDEPGWVRPAGIVQMLLFVAALAPFGGRATWAAVRLLSPIQTPVQVAGLLFLQHRRTRG
jgi:phosphatidylglycerophosphate synthase